MDFTFQNSKLKIILLGIAVILAAILIFVFIDNFNKEKLEVFFLDVGQGDSIFIQAPQGQNIIIDGGPDRKVVKELSRYLPWWDKTIDLMILTHPHDDHVTGLIEIIKHYNVENIVYTGAAHNSPNFLSWLEIIKKENIPVKIPIAPESIILGNDCKMQFFYPFKNLYNQENENLNNTSIVLKLIYKNTSFLFAGDIEEGVENELIDNYCVSKNISEKDFYCIPQNNQFNLRADVFKANHHGSDTSNSEEFLRAVNPVRAVISAGKENNFNHPSLRVINRFKDFAISFYRTDLKGTIRMESDGELIGIK